IQALEPLNYKLADPFPPTRTVASLIERTRNAIPQEEASNTVDCNKEVFNYKEAAFNKAFNYEDAIYISPPRQTSFKLSDPGAKTPSNPFSTSNNNSILGLALPDLPILLSIWIKVQRAKAALASFKNPTLFCAEGPASND
ncbi:hypothetical protein L249_5662, partial [Ophiocordyceps polyrhachis-furcata BCC 54312]